MSDRAQHRSFDVSRYRRPSPWEGELDTRRTWPDRELTQAPRWCSVDLRDGNQALPVPMSIPQKLEYFDVLVACGFTEIEVGFPAANEREWGFCRSLIEHDRIPASVTPQVLTSAHPHVIDRTVKAVAGARRMRIHLYHTVSPRQCEIVFGPDFVGAAAAARTAAGQCRVAAEQAEVEELSFEFSPESFTQAPLSDTLAACEAVLEELMPSPERPLVLNFPATVEVCSPHRFADAIATVVGRLPQDGSVVVSVHPHNDRGTAVAAAEAAVLAGAERVEGCLFGHGERAGNVCLLTLVLNCAALGVDPGVWLGDVRELTATIERLTGQAVSQRHPYAGALAFHTLAGTHQDAIDKALSAHHEQDDVWDIPYLPMDPRDVGQPLSSVLAVSDQSGKAGVGYVVRREFGLDAPAGLRAQWAAAVAYESARAAGAVDAQDLARWLAPAGDASPWGEPGEWSVASPLHRRNVDAWDDLPLTRSTATSASSSDQEFEVWGSSRIHVSHDANHRESDSSSRRQSQMVVYAQHPHSQIWHMAIAATWETATAQLMDDLHARDGHEEGTAAAGQRARRAPSAAQYRGACLSRRCHRAAHPPFGGG